MNFTEMLSITEAAKVLGLTPRRVRVLASEGRFNGAQLLSSGWVIPAEAVNAFAALPLRKGGRPVTTGAGLARKDRREKREKAEKE